MQMQPKTEDELSEMLAMARAPVSVRGGGTRGAVTEGVQLETGGMSGITLYDPGALTLVAAAGTPLAEIEAALTAENQRLAFEPMDHRGLLGTTGAPTIGGVVAVNASGPRRVQVGACRDHLLGVRFVDGAGTVVKNGGRVMKNVTGYDLVKLLAGSWGTLGVLSQVSLKVLPQTETEATLVLPMGDMTRAVRALSAALGSPFEVTGAAYGRVAQERAVLIRIEGFAASVTYRVGRLAAALAAFGTAEVVADPAQSRAIWRDVRDVAAFHGTTGDVWRLSVKPGDAPGIAAGLGAEDLLLDWGGGLIWARVPKGTDLRARAQHFAGHATLVRGDTLRFGRFHPEPAPLAAISTALRRRFDPRGILNIGLMDAPAEALA